MFQTKKKITHTMVLTAMISAAPITQVMAEDEFTAAITGGKVSGEVRLRLETVEQDNTLKDATALTVRTRLGYETASFKDFSAKVEMSSNSALIDDYSGQYSVVGDPEGAEMNQSYISYKGFSETEIKYGRQRVILDNARHIGNVGWRNNEQTFDALTIANKSLKDTTLIYGYVTSANGINFTNTDVKAHLLNASYAGLPVGKITGYSYLLEMDDTPANSSSTTGLRFAGETDSLIYTLEYAKQSDYKDGSSTIDADYTLAELGAKVSGVTAKLGYEVLGGDGTYAFQTPLATKHAFNGWADQFLASTPTQGLKDAYLSVGGKAAGIKLLAVYHNYETDSGGVDAGDEVNLLAAKKFGKHYSVVAKYASYKAGNLAGKDDTDKMWLMGVFSF